MYTETERREYSERIEMAEAAAWRRCLSLGRSFAHVSRQCRCRRRPALIVTTACWSLAGRRRISYFAYRDILAAVFQSTTRKIWYFVRRMSWPTQTRWRPLYRALVVIFIQRVGLSHGRRNAANRYAAHKITKSLKKKNIHTQQWPGAYLLHRYYSNLLYRKKISRST